MTDIDSVTAMNLAEGRDIIDITVESIAMTMDVSEDVRFGRFAKPGSYPLLPDEASTLPWWARRIVANLMESGWTPPGEQAIADAVQASRERSEWWKANRDKPCGCGHEFMAHSGEGDHCVDCATFDGAECWTWKPTDGGAA